MGFRFTPSYRLIGPPHVTQAGGVIESAAPLNNTACEVHHNRCSTNGGVAAKSSFGWEENPWSWQTPEELQEGAWVLQARQSEACTAQPFRLCAGEQCLGENALSNSYTSVSVHARGLKSRFGDESVQTHTPLL